MGLGQEKPDIVKESPVKLMKSAALVPMGTFVLALLLGILARTPEPAFGVRAAQAGTGDCQLTIDITAMAANAKRHSINITVCDIKTTNTKQASLNASSQLLFTANVKGKDNSGANFEFNGLVVSANFTPATFDRNHSPGGRTDSFKPQQCLSSVLDDAATAAANDILNRNGLGPGTHVRVSYPAQSMDVITHCSYTCVDGIFKPFSRKLSLPVDAKGNGAATFP